MSVIERTIQVSYHHRVLFTRRVFDSSKPVLRDALADGEEKERKYRVAYDPSVKGPIKKVLEAVKAAKVGDRVRLEWVEGEGYNITAFEVLKKK